MKITLISPQKNEADLLPFFFNYYEQFVDKIVIVDNQSDDSKVFDLYKQYGVEVRTLDTGGKNDSLAKRAIRNNLYKEYETDWVIVCDADEFLYHKNGMRTFLQNMFDTGITIMQPTGYDMVSMEFPKPEQRILPEHFKMGCLAPGYSKLACFQSCVDINYGCGAHPHDTYPKGKVIKVNDPNYKLLHYAWIGFDYRFKKEVWRAGIRSESNIKNGWSTSLEVASNKKLSLEHFAKLLAESRNVLEE